MPPQLADPTKQAIGTICGLPCDAFPVQEPAQHRRMPLLLADKEFERSRVVWLAVGCGKFAAQTPERSPIGALAQLELAYRLCDELAFVRGQRRSAGKWKVRPVVLFEVASLLKILCHVKNSI